MIVKILGSLDILSAIIFWLFITFNIFQPLILVIALYLIIKGALFLMSKDIASALDVISGIIILASTAYSVSEIVSILVILYLLQKGIFSLIN